MKKKQDNSLKKSKKVVQIKTSRHSQGNDYKPGSTHDLPRLNNQHLENNVMGDEPK